MAREAEELAIKDEAEQERAALERQAQAEAEERLRRAVVERAWRESQEYARGVADLKKKVARRAAWRAPLVAAAVLVGIAALGAILYHFPGARDEGAAKVASPAIDSRVREGESTRADGPAEAAGQLVPAQPEVAPEPEPAPRAAEDRERALRMKAEEEAARKAELEAKAQAEAMAQAEALARASSAQAREAPRAPQRAGEVFQDCPDCPRMVVIPAGEFTMGSLASEAERGNDEGPPRRVAIERPFALGRTEVTVAEFRRFAEALGYRTEAEREAGAQGCSGFIYVDPAAAGAEAQGVTSWRNPGLAQADSHPALCLSWNDARAYAEWLSKKTGKGYRLPSEAEWEYAARAGTSAARYWGDEPGEACRFANVADQSRFQTLSFGQKHECNDGHYFTAPAGSYAQNLFGLYDMLGNVWEWTEDCWHASYAGAPAGATAWLGGDCAQRVSRGGSWSTVPRFARSAARNRNSADHRDNLTGFRLARTLE